MMRTTLLAAALATTLAGCHKKPDDVPATDATAPAAQSDDAAADASPAPPDAAASEDTAPVTEAVEPSDAKRERAGKQAKLDYATMEDGHLNDAKGQWAASATASSSFGSANDAEPGSHDGNTPWHATGAPDDDDWTNNSQSLGFDWIQLKYATAVTPVEIRAVLTGNEATESITKVELIDTTGKSHVVWSGLSDAKRDERGRRTWFVRKVDGADYTTDTVKLTFANNVASGYKTVDAVQLVGK